MGSCRGEKEMIDRCTDQLEDQLAVCVVVMMM